MLERRLNGIGEETTTKILSEDGSMEEQRKNMDN